MADLMKLYDLHITTSVNFARDPFGIASPVYPFGSDVAMPACDAQDLIAQVADNGIFPEPCNVPLIYRTVDGRMRAIPDC